MTPMQMKQAQLEAVKQWRLDVQAGPERKDSGSNYTPAPRNVSILRYVTKLDGSGSDDPLGLHAEMKRIIDHPNFERQTQGWDRCLSQHTPEGLWEWIIMDRSSVFAPLWTNEERAVVARSVANTYNRI
jgi:hypothetical protein